MTPTDTPEQLFQRFQQAGDPADLAKVFDATAPQLLLLAAHVSPDGGAAEDLLQETFLQAMQRAEQWDAERPLLPWLAGILRHRAQDLARKLRLRRPKAELSDLVVAADGAGPLAEAESNELLRRVQAALDSLQSPFREALVLRLVHGLQPTEIAHALGRPPATVRGQLKRGLEVLRGVLPASLASGLAMLLLPGRGVAATRAALLAATGREKVTAVALGGSSRSAVWVTSIACMLGVFVGGYFLFFNTVPVAPPSGTVEAAEAAEQPSSESDKTVAELVEPRREVTVVTKAADQQDTSTLRGRCVRVTDGLPLEGGTATVSFGRGRFMTQDEEFRNWPDPIEVRIGAGGLFAIEWQPKKLQRVYLEVATPGHSTATEEWISLRSGIDVDLGDIALLPGCLLQARVVDEQGAPVPRAWISIERRSGGVADASFQMWRSIDRKSDEQGLLGDELLPPGTYGVASRHDEALYKVLRPTHIELDGVTPRTIDIVVRRTGVERSIAGRVTDQSGQAVAGLIVCLDPDYVDLGKTVTEADGSFYLPIQYPRKTQPLGIPATEQRYRLLGEPREYTVGDQDVQLRVQRQPAVDVPVVVVDARTGKPVEQFGIAHELDYWSGEHRLVIPPDRFYRPVAPARYTGGRTVLQVYPGQHRLMVWPEDKNLATAYMIPFTVGAAGAEPIRVELQGYAEAKLLLKDESGQPMPGVEVRLTHSLASGPHFGSMWSVEEFALGVGGGRSTGVALQTQTTDAEGRAVFRAPIAEQRLGLQLSGTWVRWQRRPIGVVGREGATWEITLPALARVHGTVGPDAFLQRTGPSPEEILADSMVRSENSELHYSCASIWLESKSGEHGGRGFVRPDGSFVIDAAKPGNYQIRIEDDHIGQVTVGELQLQAGEDREIAVDASKFVPARLTASVFVDGAPWLRGEFGLIGVDHRETVDVNLGSDGRGTVLTRPARYLPYVSWQDDAGTHKLFAADRTSLASGSDATQSFFFEQRVLRLQVVNSDGTPAKDQLLFASLVDYPEAYRMIRGAVRADADGMVTLDPALPGRVELRLTRDGGSVVATVASEPRPTTEVRVVLPK